MPKKAAKPRKNAVGGGCKPASKPKKASADKRLNDILDAMIDELLESLEHNYNRKKQEKP